MNRSYDSGSDYRPATLTLPGRRPELPHSTPAPGLRGLPNPYSSHERSLKKTESMPNVKASDLSVNANRLILEKMCHKLPFDVRETVMSIVNSSLASSAQALKAQENSVRELHHLRNEIKAKTSEIDILAKRCDKYQDVIRLKDEQIEQMADEEQHNKEHQNKSTRSMTRLAKTNRVLIGAFEALGKPQTRSKSSTPIPYSRTRGDKRTAGPLLPSLLETNSSPNLLPETPERPSPLIRQSSSAPHGDELLDFDEIEAGAETKDHDASQNGKIRASLLRMARDYYKMVKNIDLLNLEVELLTTNLKHSEKRNRQMQLELEEIRENASISSQGSNGVFNAIRPDSPDLDKKDKGAGVSKRGATKTLEVVDKRLAELVSKRAFDPLEGIRQMRLMFMHMSKTPSSLSQADVASHICSREVCKMFEVDAIACFVLQPGGELIRKYTSRGVECVNYALGEGRSAAETVLRTGRDVKINSNKHKSKLDSFVDGVDGVHTRKMLCIPLVDAHYSRVVGCLQFINKYQNFKFSEVDELFAMMFGDIAGTFLASSLLFSRVWDRSTVLTNILEASTSVFSSMPDAMSLTSSMPLEADQVLIAIEESCRKALSCSKVKAFIASGAIGLGEGSIVVLEDDEYDFDNKVIKRKNKSGSIYTVIPELPGIAGMTLKNGKPYLMTNQGGDPFHNPQVDLSCHTEHVSMLTIPITTLQGEVIAAVQMIRGPKSPKFESGPSSVLTGRILFEPAAEWLSFQLSHSLQHILANVGKPCSIPRALPAQLEPMQRINPTSLVLKPIALGDKPSDPSAITDESIIGIDETETDSFSGRRFSTMEDSQPMKRKYSSENNVVAIRHLQVIREHEVHESHENVPASAPQSGPESPVCDQIVLLKAEIKQLKQTIGRLSTVDLNSLKTSSNKKSAIPTISESESYGSDARLLFSDDDFDRDDAANSKLSEENMHLKEENENLRSEFESLKELYASKEQNFDSTMAAKISEIEERVASRLRAEIKIENDRLLAKELGESNATFMAKIRELESKVAAEGEEKKLLKASLDRSIQQIASQNGELESLRKAIHDASRSIETERQRATTAEADVLRLEALLQKVPSPQKTQKLDSVKQEPQKTAASNKSSQGASEKALTHHHENPTTSSSGKHVLDEHASAIPHSRESQRSHVGEPAPPAPTEDMVPTSPRYEGWARFVDESGYPYFHNSITGETSWERPEHFPEDHEIVHHDAAVFGELTHHDDYQNFDHHSSGSHLVNDAYDHHDVVRVGNWVQGFDSASGAPYWRNEVSGESVWELPENAYEGSIGELHHEGSFHDSHSAAGSVQHQGSVSSIEYGAASAGDYKIEL